MSGHDREEGCVFEIAVVVPKWGENKGDESDVSVCVGVLVDQLRKRGLIVERVVGLQNEFIKVYSSLIYIYIFYVRYYSVLFSFFSHSSGGSCFQNLIFV